MSAITKEEYEFAVKSLSTTLNDIEKSKERQLELVRQLSNERIHHDSLFRWMTHCEDVISEYENDNEKERIE